MALLNRLGSSLALSLRLSSRQFAACQGAAIHMSSVTEARRRKQEESDDESDAEAETPSVVARQPAEDDEVEWPPAIDQSQLRSLDGTIPQEPMSRLVMEDNGRWDVNAAISPALAAALEAAPARSDDEADASIQQLHDALAALEKGKTLKDDEPASDDDLRRVAEAIDLYFLAAPETDAELDGLEDTDRDLLEALSETLKEVLDGGARSKVVNTAPAGRLPWEVIDVEDETPMINWGVDLTEGKAQDPWKNALLSEDAKQAMWELHQKGWSAEQVAEHFGIRQQRALAILALQEREHQAREHGLPMHSELAEAMEDAYDAVENVGARERHHVVLPSFPNYRELTEDDAEKLAALLEKRLGKRFDDIGLEDMTPEVTQELLAAAGMDKGAIEEQLAQKEEEQLVAEFAANLQYNMGKTGAGLSRSSRKTHPPKRPEGGWSLLVQPLGKAARGAADVAAAQQPFVVAPDGTRRELTEDEKVKLQRQAARPRHKVC